MTPARLLDCFLVCFALLSIPSFYEKFFDPRAEELALVGLFLLGTSLLFSPPLKLNQPFFLFSYSSLVFLTIFIYTNENCTAKSND